MLLETVQQRKNNKDRNVAKLHRISAMQLSFLIASLIIHFSFVFIYLVTHQLIELNVNAHDHERRK